MPEIISVAYNDSVAWEYLWFALVPIAVGLVFSILISFDDDGSAIGAGLIFSLVVLLALAVTLSILQGDVHEEDKVSALTKAGFSQVEYGKTAISAIFEGERVMISLFDRGTVEDVTTYQIVEIPVITK